MIETPQRKPSVLRIGGRYLLSTSTTVGSLTVAENAELVMGENLELQTRGILVKGRGFYICEASCQFTYPMLAGTGAHMIQFVLVWALWAYVTIFTFHDHLDKLSTLWKITIFHNISQFFTISWKQTSPKFHQNFHHILGTEFQQFANTLAVGLVGFHNQEFSARAPKRVASRGWSSPSPEMAIRMPGRGAGARCFPPFFHREMPCFFQNQRVHFPAKQVHVK